jgi:hypothetical protein
MTLGELIKFLDSCKDKSTILRRGFWHPHSYRGYYDELAFEPRNEVSIDSMLTSACSAVGETYTGWKGGQFTMTHHTPVYLAYEGNTGKEITSDLLLDLMSDSYTPPKEIVVLPPEPEDEPVDVTFSVNEYDYEGDISQEGIFLHFEGTRVWVAKDPKGYDAFVAQLVNMKDEMTDHWREMNRG